MSNEKTATSESAGRLRLAVITTTEKKLNQDAVRFLILHLNCVQEAFEYEFANMPGDPFLSALQQKQPVDREAARLDSLAFATRCDTFWKEQNERFGLKEAAPSHFIVISLATFSNNYYSMRQGRVSVLALGNWRRWMAPPSLLEFLLTLVVRESVAALSPALRGSVHLGTKGCLFDFTAYLSEVKFKVLQGHICQFCEDALRTDELPTLAEQLRKVLSKAWIGEPSVPGSPAYILKNLGYDLFLTKGTRSTFWEQTRITLQQDGVKEIIKIAGGLALVALLIWLGLQKH